MVLPLRERWSGFASWLLSMSPRVCYVTDIGVDVGLGRLRVRGQVLAHTPNRTPKVDDNDDDDDDDDDGIW